MCVWGERTRVAGGLAGVPMIAADAAKCVRPRPWPSLRLPDAPNCLCLPPCLRHPPACLPPPAHPPSSCTHAPTPKAEAQAKYANRRRLTHATHGVHDIFDADHVAPCCRHFLGRHLLAAGAGAGAPAGQRGGPRLTGIAVCERIWGVGVGGVCVWGGVGWWWWGGGVGWVGGWVGGGGNG